MGLRPASELLLPSVHDKLMQTKQNKKKQHQNSFIALFPNMIFSKKACITIFYSGFLCY